MKIRLLDYGYQLIVIFLLPENFGMKLVVFQTQKLCNISFVLNVIQIYDS